MEKDLTFKVYMVELETGYVREMNKEFSASYQAKEECDFLNRMSATMPIHMIKYFFFFEVYNDFSAFDSQEKLREKGLIKLNEWNKEINKVKSLFMVATKSLMQGGLNKEEAV